MNGTLSEGADALRRRRNALGMAAAACVVVTLAGVMPRFLGQHRELKATSQRIVALQDSIRGTQAETKLVQEEIVRTQAEIRRRLGQ